MKWEIVLTYLVGGIISENIGVKIINTNHGWISQVGGPRSNRQNNNCPASCRCGVPNVKTRIIGGQKTRLADYPWVVYMESQVTNGVLPCGGSLINDRYILTAAHCIKAVANTTTAILKLENTGNLTIIQIKKIKEIIIHPGWNDATQTGDDIALLKMTDPVKFDGAMGTDDYLSPLCVAKDPTKRYEGVNATTIGWGLTDGKVNTSRSPHLLEVAIDVVKDVNCLRQLGAHVYDSNTMLCAGTRDGKLGTCSGDSGGPLHNPVTASDGTIYLEEIGITSFGAADCDSHSVFTRVATFGKWITQNTADACECARKS